jgi:hypothetical protein
MGALAGGKSILGVAIVEARQLRPPRGYPPLLETARLCVCTAGLLNFCDSKAGVALAELIKLIVQVLDDVLRFNRGEFFFCHMTAAGQLIFQRIQRPNESVLAGVDASIVASHAVSVMQALPVGAVARQCGVSARRQQDQ